MTVAPDVSDDAANGRQEPEPGKLGSRGEVEHRWWRFRHHEQYLYWLAKLLLLIIVGAGVWWVFLRLGGVLLPLFVGLLVAYLLHPLTLRMVAFGLPRGAAIAIIGTSFLGALVGLLLLVVPTLTDEVGRVVQRLPEWLDDRVQWLVGLAEERFAIDAERVDELLRQLGEEAQGVVLGLLDGAREGASSLINLILIPIFSFYFLVDFERTIRRPLLLVPERFHARIIERAVRMDTIVGNWIRGQFKVASILAVVFAVGLWLMDVKLGIVLGIVAGLLNVIPFVGSATGVILALLMVLLEGSGFTRLLLVAGFFAVVQAVESYWLTPRIVGQALGFGPMTIIVAILAGGALFGFLGVLLAVPATAAGTVLARDMLDWYQQTAFWRGCNGEGTRTGQSASAVADGANGKGGAAGADALQEAEQQTAGTLETGGDAQEASDSGENQAPQSQDRECEGSGDEGGNGG
ncbi:MAG: AI-2E family transporter [Deltaproteobacteria bacterium]|nr:MAG: AI-2E family transporter [Deltaproteobacteria bacterium]